MKSAFKSLFCLTKGIMQERRLLITLSCSALILLAIIILLYFSPNIIQTVKKSPGSGSEKVAAKPNDKPFTFVLFPDTQYAVQSYPRVWESMTSWVADNRETQNIQAVIGLGDVTNEHTLNEFQEAVRGWDVIDDAGLPYIPVIGNHDYNGLSSRNATNWNRFLGVERFSKKSWYGRAHNDSTENFFIKFDVGSHKYLILALEFFPNRERLRWAQDIINSNKDREIIVATHGYLNHNGKRTRHGDAWGPDEKSSDGQEIWDNLIKGNPNIFLTTCGHQIGGPTSALSKDTGNTGNTVQQIFLNYQNVQNGGNGYLGLLKFRPSDGFIDMTAYSPYLNEYDPAGTQTLEYSTLDIAPN
jgi:hypothetical protein